MKSLFITFEGIEACGKSTQAKLLQNALNLKNIAVLLTREPGGPHISEKIRELLLDSQHTEMTSETELLLYLAARNQHTAQWILPALKNNKCVICDRYFDSTFAYQGAARKIDLKMIEFINDFATYNLKPDLTFIIDIPVQISQERLIGKKLDRIEFESVEFHNNVREFYLQTAKKSNRYIIIDGNNKIEDVHNKIFNIVNSKLEELK